MTTTVEGIRASTVRASHEVRRANADRVSPNHVDECFLCGRGLTEKAADSAWFIHLVDGGSTIAPNGMPDQGADDLGWFPLGSECAKKIARTHKARMT